MQNWQKSLNGDPFPWLLDPENPSIRYWTLVDILERPENDPEEQETRATIAALNGLAAHGYAHDDRFAALLKLVIDRQNEQGKWLCGSVSRTWPVEKRNQPSKWVTLDALRVLKYIL